MENLFNSILSSASLSITIGSIVTILLTGLLTGVIIAYLYNIKTRSSKSFLTTLAMLPAIVSMVIIMVNGDVGAGVAVAGAFSLIRFRSVPGTAREIGAIFLAMSTGITLGMGFIGFAILFTLILCVFYLILDLSSLGNQDENKRKITIVIPEDLNYTTAFDKTFEKFTVTNEIVQIKSTNMGSMFKLKYDIILKNEEEEKKLIDELRAINGNLDILVTGKDVNSNEL